VQLKEHRHLCESVLQHEQVASAVHQLRQVLGLLPVLTWPGKSVCQPKKFLLQPLTNEWLEHWLSHVLDWRSQVAVTPGKRCAGAYSDGTFDFCLELDTGDERNVIAVEVQLGNGGRKGDDLRKFQALGEQGRLLLAVLVQFDAETARLADSGLAHFEKTVHALGAAPLAVPLLMLGLSHRDTPYVDMRECKDIVDARYVGGRGGTGSKKLKRFVAERLADDVAPCDIVLPADMRETMLNHRDGQKRSTRCSACPCAAYAWGQPPCPVQLRLPHPVPSVCLSKSFASRASDSGRRYRVPLGRVDARIWAKPTEPVGLH
jgi:hypothetical protein